jgi:hypothetical protein
MLSSKISRGIKLININSVIPLIGQEAASKLPDPIANKRCFVVLDICTNLNFFEALAITILPKIIKIYL